MHARRHTHSRVGSLSADTLHSLSFDAASLSEARMRQHIGMHAVPRARVPTAHLEPMCWELDARYDTCVYQHARRVHCVESSTASGTSSLCVLIHTCTGTRTLRHSVMGAPTPVAPPC